MSERKSVKGIKKREAAKPAGVRRRVSGAGETADAEQLSTPVGNVNTTEGSARGVEETSDKPNVTRRKAPNKRVRGSSESADDKKSAPASRQDNSNSVPAKSVMDQMDAFTNYDEDEDDNRHDLQSSEVAEAEETVNSHIDLDDDDEFAALRALKSSPADSAFTKGETAEKIVVERKKRVETVLKDGRVKAPLAAKSRVSNTNISVEAAEKKAHGDSDGFPQEKREALAKSQAKRVKEGRPSVRAKDRRKYPERSVREVSDSDVDLLMLAAIAGCLTVKMASDFSINRTTRPQDRDKQITSRGVSTKTARNRMPRVADGVRPLLNKVKPGNTPPIYVLTNHGHKELLQRNALQEEQILHHRLPLKGKFYAELFHNLGIAQTIVTVTRLEENMLRRKYPDDLSKHWLSFNRDPEKHFFIHEHEVEQDLKSHWSGIHAGSLGQAGQYQKDMSAWDHLPSQEDADRELVDNPRLWATFDGLNTHRSDVILYRPEGKSEVFEIENSVKKTREYDKIFQAYETEYKRMVSDRPTKISRVRYFCTNRRILKQVTRAAQNSEAGIRLLNNGFLKIMPLVDGHGEVLELDGFLDSSHI